MLGEFLIRIFDVEHGACAIMRSLSGNRIAMVDSGHKLGWRPSTYIRGFLRQPVLDYLFVTNADQDHLSDLAGLLEEGVDVRVLHRNPTPPASILRWMKEQNCGALGLTDDIERFLWMHENYILPIDVPFDAGMDGVTVERFWHAYPQFVDTNNLSQVLFFSYGAFTICFPGDLEEEGWLAMLEKPGFIAALQRTTVLVASHHGRRNGYCAEIFDYFTPRAVVISDKPIAHETQEIDYSPVVHRDGIIVANQDRNRHVLTTRRDGSIMFDVTVDGDFRVTTERNTNRQAA